MSFLVIIFLFSFFPFTSVNAQTKKTVNAKKRTVRKVRPNKTNVPKLVQPAQGMMRSYCGEPSTLILNFFYRSVSRTPLLLRDGKFVTKNSKNEWDENIIPAIEDVALAKEIVKAIKPQEMEFFVPGLIKKTKKTAGSLNTIVIKKETITWDDVEALRLLFKSKMGNNMGSSQLGCANLMLLSNKTLKNVN